MNEKSTLVLITKPLDQNPPVYRNALLTGADKVVMIQDGVYTRPPKEEDEDTFELPGGHRAVAGSDGLFNLWPENWFVLGEDAEARRVEPGCGAIDYQQLVNAIEQHEKIVTL
jgi:sulfur transfer complex TusBCD TusB component (DsrH family)